MPLGLSSVLDRQTKMAIAIVVVAILALLILATYGYLTGAWDAV